MWRLKLRQAKIALRDGRLGEAGRLLSRNSLRQFYPAQRLAEEVAERLVERALVAADRGRSEAGWRDLNLATALGGCETRLDETHRRLIERGLGEARRLLESGATAEALATLDALQQRGVSDSAVRCLRQAGQLLKQADALVRDGSFPAAEACLARAEPLTPGLEVVGQQRQRCRLQAAEYRRRSVELHRAATAREWTTALEAAQAILVVSPADRAAQAVRRQAWSAVRNRCQAAQAPGNGPAAVVSYDTLPAPQPPLQAESDLPENGSTPEDGPKRESDPRRKGEKSSLRLRFGVAWKDLCPFGAAKAERTHGASNHASSRRAKVEPVAETAANKRFLMWIDGVGGYLVCLGDCVVLGQGAGGSDVDIPILGDLSRRHAAIRRDGEGYLLDPVHEVRVNGRPTCQVRSLEDGDRLQMGSVIVRFRRPHALSATVRLERLSHHKTHPSADAVLLMADTCVLGPAPHSHVVCRAWSRDVVIFRTGNTLHCRSAGPLEIDGIRYERQGELTDRARVVGEDFSLNFEPWINDAADS